jgi:3-methyl-2-oxobutanoate hydroxymethyltransferase
MTTESQPGRTPISELAALKRRREKIVIVTAYDAPSARLAEEAGIDVVLVGDSAAMTMLGYDSTLPITLDEIVMLTRAVVRGVRRAMVIADMPFGSFQVSDESAIAAGITLLKDAGADAVKVEGAGPTLSRIRALTEAGVPVVGHIGLTPQSAALLGGYKPQGRTAIHAGQLCDDAAAIERAGAIALVLEAMPAPVAARITTALAIPTIGIGAGSECDGQVLVWHDLLGVSAGRVPRFVRRYASIAGTIHEALAAYANDVRSGQFPAQEHTYPMPDEEREAFDAIFRK